MAMNPVHTTHRIESDYLNYLRSILKVKSAELSRKANQVLTATPFVKGPFLESTPPFVTGSSLAELIDEGVACVDFRRLEESAEIHRPLYAHQEASFRQIVSEKRNLIVATGTGSGKTESFLYPIFNELMRAKKAGTLGPGVRALLLYPMNALANDQMKRLRGLLKDYPDITFGRYTGETLDSERKALDDYQLKKEKDLRSHGKVRGRDYTAADLRPLPNELISREAMRKTPPHLLLTNYAMLEYLLLRPDDTTFFDGELANNWQFIVLDEAHTYKGANGTEIALLLRRLKERIHTDHPLRCIATSATLGSPDALPDLARFAQNIFDEPFEVCDIITSQRKKRVIEPDMDRFELADYKRFETEVAAITSEDKGNAWLHERLVKDERIIILLNYLESRPKNFQAVASHVFSDLSNKADQQAALVLLIQLGARAKLTPDSNSLIPARYHLFVRALEGFYVSLFPDRRVYLDRKEFVSISGRDIPAFELADCQECGQEYLIGQTRDSMLRPPREGEPLEYYLLPHEAVESDEPETNGDDVSFEIANVKKLEPYDLCTACGRIHPAGIKQRKSCCDVLESSKILRVYRLQSSAREVNTCVACGAVGHGKIKRFMTANQPSTFILASSLYAMIPPQKIDQKGLPTVGGDGFFDLQEEVRDEAWYDESGRKLLVFSDNRQEAAFFAAYMENKYNQQMWRKLMLKELRQHPEGFLLVDFLSILVRRGKEAGLFDDSLTQAEREFIAGVYLMKEFTGFERNKGLEGSGYIHFMPYDLKLQRGAWGFSSEELSELCAVLLDTFRFTGATTYPEHVDPEKEQFSPRNRQVYFRKAESGSVRKSTITSFLPTGSASNRRLDYLSKILQVRGLNPKSAREEALSILAAIYDQIIPGLLQMNYLSTTTLAGEGALLCLNHRKWHISYYKDHDEAWQCNRCGRITSHNVHKVCPEFRCHGSLERMSAHQFRDDPYYAPLYADDKLLPMISREHTGQLTKDTAGSTQTQFENGDINVLSCTTTFEMGVDVGQLEAILLRNVPPETANYVQRAGRAGRRKSSTAFSLTYARRNSHDLNYFQDPTEIISGKIKAPYIELNNDKIASRHVNSIVLAWFFRSTSSGREYFRGNAEAMVGSRNGLSADIVELLNLELSKRPEELISAIEKILTPAMMEKLRIRDWKFVDQLAGENGVLSLAVQERKDELDQLDEHYRARIQKKERTDDLLRLIKTLEDQGTIAFLASGGVIPKYGFPIDVVKLDILAKSSEARSVDLSRDLKLAVSEYAPGSEIIAGGKIWTSYALNRVRDKEWPVHYFWECPDCHRSTFPEELTTLEDVSDQDPVRCECGMTMKQRKMIRPIFGFSTAWDDEGRSVGESRPQRFYPTRVQFGGFDQADPLSLEENLQREIPIGDRIVKAHYAPQGKLVIMNRGLKGAGLLVCKYCGFATTNYGGPPEHQTKMGRTCSNKYLINTALGHIFKSDVLRLKFPPLSLRQIEEKDAWITLLYAILEGAADALGIARDDINGCMDYSEEQPVLILFDETPGGAGHVKRIYHKLDEVLRSAWLRVDGHCNCGEETACYGCLRSYSNQLDHDRLARGLARQYLEWLLLSSVNMTATPLAALSDNTEKNPTETTIPIPAPWQETLKQMMRPSSDASHRYAMELIRSGNVPSPDAIGYELVSEERGVLGYEAEMAWTERKIALLSHDDPDLITAAQAEFNAQGWQVFTIDQPPQDLIRILQ
ncbi:DEAD/DEAH box helicase [Proteiniclasticum sp. QWL-01]|uniref:DEAD/DEAH box helicase n=1 Tax=Proteiniclasticum sp. QWL-01 TaxID=3036945 RepID=UPI002410E8B2|nr:DEAD/DEAH box helicase [Proteiniclasticum sp. QWL-01]WFF74366.1 DEAD/DEAH box helicase [Proteiniclasticum sp. QWL-01]